MNPRRNGIYFDIVIAAFYTHAHAAGMDQKRRGYYWMPTPLPLFPRRSNAPNQGLVRMTQGGAQLTWPTNSTNLVQYNMLTGISTGTGDPRSGGLGGSVFNSFGFLWQSDCIWGLSHYRLVPNGTYQWTTYFRGPQGQTFRHMSGKNTTAGFVLVASQCQAPFSLWHFNVSRGWNT